MHEVEQQQGEVEEQQVRTHEHEVPEAPEVPEPTSEDIGPLVKIPGGKSLLASAIVARMPSRITRYFEPFMGGAAVWCELVRHRRLDSARTVVLNDVDYWLVEAMRDIKEEPSVVSDKLEALKAAYEQPEKAEHVYYAVRDSWNRNIRSSVKRIFLSQGAFNGLWRENKRGHMNAAWNKRSTIVLPSRAKVLALHSALARVELVHGDFEECISPREHEEGSVVYFDPPYLRTWNDYHAGGFGLVQHGRLLDFCRTLGLRGVTVLYSNDGAEQTRALIAKHWPEAKVEVLYARRRINRDGAGRGEVPELLCSVNAVER
jgi:DNA adenine methylase